MKVTGEEAPSFVISPDPVILWTLNRSVSDMLTEYVTLYGVVVTSWRVGRMNGCMGGPCKPVVNNIDMGFCVRKIISLTVIACFRS